MAHEELVKEGKKALMENIDPKEIQNYFLKEGMDKKEAEQSIEQIVAAQIVENDKKAKKEKRLKKGVEQKTNTPSATEKKYSVWIYIVFILLIGFLAYLFYSGVIDLYG